MSQASIQALLEEIDGRTALRLWLSVSHPTERVWRAVSMPAELECFFPGAAAWTPAEGESLDLGGSRLTVTDVAPPHRLAWTLAGQSQSFDLEPADTGCTVVFTHVIDDLPAAQTAAGWATYLSRLQPHLDGGHLSDEEAHADWSATHERYALQFGVDPEPGRRWAAVNLPADEAERG